MKAMASGNPERFLYHLDCFVQNVVSSFGFSAPHAEEAAKNSVSRIFHNNPSEI
jgi:hypothetical protein